MVLENALVSVIMPAYNVEKYIGEAIESILNQSYSNIELLICDDGSSDNTIAICEEYEFQDNRVKVFKNTINKGNLYTTNLLFLKCKGDFITIQDADDYSDLNRLEILLNTFLKKPVLGMVGSYFEAVSNNKESLFCGRLPKEDLEIKKIMKKEVIPMLYASIMVRREVFHSVGLFRVFFNRKGYADFDFMARCAEITCVENVPKVLYYYRKHDESFNFSFLSKTEGDIILKNMDFLIIEAHRRRLNHLTDFFDGKGNISSIKRILSFRYLKQAEYDYWKGDYVNSITKIKISLKLNLLNLKALRTFFYIYRKSKI